MSLLACRLFALGIIGLEVLSAAPGVSRATELLRSLPIMFEPNQGQYGEQVKFTARTRDYRVFLSARGVVFKAANQTVSVSPLNANPNAEVSADGALPARTNYILGSRKENWQGPERASRSRRMYR